MKKATPLSSKDAPEEKKDEDCTIPFSFAYFIVCVGFHIFFTLFLLIHVDHSQRGIREEIALLRNTVSNLYWLQLQRSYNPGNLLVK